MLLALSRCIRRIEVEDVIVFYGSRGLLVRENVPDRLEKASTNQSCIWNAQWIEASQDLIYGCVELDKFQELLVRADSLGPSVLR